ncbi:translation elongation factor Ts [candidate division WOR-3 bacterium]|uniref:Elongation factor Ts n=1 Tax=candidate division WOR-3 bacterium TaxID=2052148 RepID=A0A9D5QEQ8_UNCW3|nr:translation elongation factor Ts [candidate division WOR-3 bacterium]MBD3365265.1 translation elongation factor Ts [candidate division WOR-3 bacterium]
MNELDSIRELRARTGAGVVDCKEALVEADGDIDKAIEILRKKGIAKADSKAGRVAKEGIIEAYIHPGAKLGVLLELNCETDFVAKNEEFQALAHDVAMHIAASDPVAVSREDVPEGVQAREKEIYTDQARESGKPDKVIDKIVEGRMDKYFKENCLLEQPFVKDPDKTVADLLKESIGKIGENIVVQRFARFKVGED